MSKIEAVLNQKKASGQKAFIPFITAGDPNLDATERFIYALAEAGSDVIELGIPFSDPIADGPVIQEANIRAMKNDVKLDKIFEMVKKVRKTTQVPLVFLLYANTVYHYGIQKFFAECAASQVEGVIIPDVPLEEREEFVVYARDYGVDVISLIAPTSKERTQEIVRDATGFLYCVSSLGVTGTRESIQTNLGEMFDEIKKYCNIPTAIGFGISNKEQAAELKEFTDGIIIGSAMVKIIAEYGEASTDKLRTFAEEIISVL